MRRNAQRSRARPGRDCPKPKNNRNTRVQRLRSCMHLRCLMLTTSGAIPRMKVSTQRLSISDSGLRLWSVCRTGLSANSDRLCGTFRNRQRGAFRAPPSSTSGPPLEAKGQQVNVCRGRRAAFDCGKAVVSVLSVTSASTRFLKSSHVQRLSIYEREAFHDHRRDSGRFASNAFAFQNNVRPVHSAPALQIRERGD